jgi:hypothetical protein
MSSSPSTSPDALPPSPVNSAPGSSGSSSPPGPVPRSRRWVAPVIALVVAAVLIVAVLAAAGFLFHKASTRTTEQYSTLNEAESVAGSSASNAISGSWNPIFAGGIRLAAGVSLPTANVSSVENLTSGCNLTSLPGAPTSLTVDATPASADAGHAAFWIFGLSNGAGTIALVSVDLGVPTALYALSGGSCASTFDTVASFPSTESDSPALVAAANASGGSAFLSEYPNSAQLFFGVGGLTYLGFTSPPLWDVVDTSCPVPLLLNETGAEFNATITGAPASVLSHSTGPVNCALGLGSSVSGFALVAGPLIGLAKAI